MTFTNNLYLILGAVTLLTPVTGLLWPDVLGPWAQVKAWEVFWLLSLAVVAFLVSSFRWETRGLVLAAAAVNAGVLLHERKRKKEDA